MLSIWLVSVLVAVILYKCYKYMFERPLNYPPGPPKIPIFGSYLFLLAINYNHIHLATATLARWYKTKILGFFYGPYRLITVHDMDTTKEVLNNPDISGRAMLPFVQARDPDFKIFGIFFTEGKFWRNQRRFMLRNLRDFGFGRRFQELEIHMDEELRDFVDLVKSGPKYDYEKNFVKEGGLVMAPYIFSILPGNLVLKCAINERLNRKDKEIVYNSGVCSIKFQRNGCMYGRIFSFLPVLKYIIPKWSGYKAIRSSSLDMYGLVNKIVLEQYNTFDPAHERHFLDLYFKEIKSANEDFSFDQINHVMLDLIFASTAAPATILTLVMQRLLLNPEYLQMCQKQIDEVVGSGRLASLDDRTSLPMVEAVIRETMRLDTLTQNNVPHRAQRDTKVGGYDLPEGSYVITVFTNAHRDEKYFKDATLFRPERFIDENGLLNLKLDITVPFGAGQRVCVAETFTRSVMFLFVCTILQNFNLSIPEGQSLPNPDVDPPQSGLNITVKDLWLKFTSR